jgi:2-methylisocitrate lyase-like PEP mutase family enzyme
MLRFRLKQSVVLLPNQIRIYRSQPTMAQTRVQQILDEVGSIVFPGIFDTLSARIAQRVGFPMAFISGYSVAATTIGEPDMGLLTQTEMVQRARQICSCVDIPIIVDADTGYGNPLNVYRTIEQLIAAGAAGCFLEDQVWPKRCGHMQGKQVISRDQYINKIRAAVDARADRDFFIVARTDALAVDGMDEAIARVEAAREAGANASFVEAPNSLEHLQEIGRRSPAPNVANMIEGGKTPVLPKSELADLGFHLILYPLSGLYAAARSIETMYEKLRTDGTTIGEEHRLMTFPQFNDLIGVEQKYEQARKYGVD